LYSSTYRSKVSLEKQTEMLKDVYGMMGKLGSAKFISYKEYVYKYVFYAKKNQIEADVALVIDKDLKLSYLSFDAIGGKGDPPPAAKKK
jgi:intein-encoded DNA endonuclease-like protein